MRTHHPDTGGDPAHFLELQRAYESLLAGGAPTRAVRGRPSRDRRDWSADVHRGHDAPVDLDVVAWVAELPDREVPLDADLVASWLARPPAGGSVRELTGSSRAPGSRLNRVGHLLSSDLTSQLHVRAAHDDRRRPVVRVEVRSGNRRARRALDAVALDDGWVRTRTSSSTGVRRSVTPATDPRATAVRTTGVLTELLDRLGWPLDTWRLTLPTR